MPNPIFHSATRIALLTLVNVLCLVILYGMVRFEDKRFELVFALFAQVTTAVLAYFSGKAASDGTKKENVAPVVEDKEHAELVDALKQ